MKDLIRYREIIRRIIAEFAQFKPARGDAEIATIFDGSNTIMS